MLQLAFHALETSPDEVIVTDAKGKIRLTNNSASRKIGYTTEEVQSMTIFDILPEMGKKDWVEMTKKIEKEKGIARSFRAKNKKGHFQDVIITPSYYNVEGEKLICLFIKEDINRIGGVLNLESSNEHVQNIINAIGDNIFVKDREHRFVLLNDANCRAIGLSREQLLGKSDYDFFPKEEADVFWEKDEYVFKTGQESINEESHTDVDGNTAYILTKKTLYRDKSGNKFIVGVSRDITARKIMEDKLKETLEIVKSLSIKDELTQLYNRRGFVTLASKQIELANRNKKPIYLLFADMDDMKLINDKFGHKEGDKALITTAEILNKTFRKSDVLGRIGGDEFVVLAVQSESSQILQDRLFNNLDEHNAKAETKYKLNISIGVATYDPELPCTIEELLEKADELMYKKKQERKKSQK
jgi:diguanylate cyclase (GGDEF)-like protein/PAS domain S-box-containing protein